MTSNERMREQPLAPLGEFYVKDVDHLRSSRSGTRNRRENRKAKQLCRQVAEVLDLVLSGDCHDELLQSLHVHSVVPAPNASRLLVTVFADLPIEDFDPREILELLERQAGRLRCEVAATISRKRVPSLAFHVAGPVAPPP